MSGNRRMEIERHIPADELDRLIEETEDDHLLRRLIFVKNLYQGDPLAEAAERVGRSDATASRWANQWNNGGLDELAPDFGGGRPPKLDEDEQEELVEILADDGPWTTQEIRQILDEEFDVSYHPNYLSRFLRSLGLRYSTPRPERPSRPDNAEQILQDRVDDALDDGEMPQNKRESDSDGGWTVEDDIRTDGGTVIGFFRRSVAATDRQ